MAATKNVSRGRVRVSDDAIDAYAMGHLDPAVERHLFLCNRLALERSKGHFDRMTLERGHAH